jgi:hypothetical protein
MSELNEIQKSLWIAFNLGLKVGQIECILLVMKG